MSAKPMISSTEAYAHDVVVACKLPNDHIIIATIERHFRKAVAVARYDQSLSAYRHAQDHGASRKVLKALGYDLRVRELQAYEDKVPVIPRDTAEAMLEAPKRGLSSGKLRGRKAAVQP